MPSSLASICTLLGDYRPHNGIIEKTTPKHTCPRRISACRTKRTRQSDRQCPLWSALSKQVQELALSKHHISPLWRQKPFSESVKYRFEANQTASARTRDLDDPPMTQRR